MQTAQLIKKKNSITKNIYLNMSGWTCLAPHELNIPGKIRIFGVEIVLKGIQLSISRGGLRKWLTV